MEFFCVCIQNVGLDGGRFLCRRRGRRFLGRGRCSRGFLFCGAVSGGLFARRSSVFRSGRLYLWGVLSLLRSDGYWLFRLIGHSRLGGRRLRFRKAPCRRRSVSSRLLCGRLFSRCQGDICLFRRRCGQRCSYKSRAGSDGCGISRCPSILPVLRRIGRHENMRRQSQRNQRNDKRIFFPHIVSLLCFIHALHQQSRLLSFQIIARPWMKIKKNVYSPSDFKQKRPVLRLTVFLIPFKDHSERAFQKNKDWFGFEWVWWR